VVGAAFVAYLSALCSVEFTATQYALLSSLAATGRTMLASSAGWLAEQLGWPVFFAATALAAVPGLWLAVYLARSASSSSSVLGQSLLSSRESARSASSLPPV
jgi:PAT family beta-lactamase induction signal transducer AmpG